MGILAASPLPKASPSSSSNKVSSSRLSAKAEKASSADEDDDDEDAVSPLTVGVDCRVVVGLLAALRWNAALREGIKASVWSEVRPQAAKTATFRAFGFILQINVRQKWFRRFVDLVQLEGLSVAIRLQVSCFIFGSHDCSLHQRWASFVSLPPLPVPGGCALLFPHGHHCKMLHVDYLPQNLTMDLHGKMRAIIMKNHHHRHRNWESCSTPEHRVV